MTTTKPTTRRPSPASTTAQPTTCPISGLFDTGKAGKEGFFPVDINEINTPDVYKVISGSTLFQTKSDASDITISIPLEGTGLELLEAPLVETNEVTLDEHLPLVSEDVTTLEAVPLVESVVVTDGAAVEGKDSNVSGMEAEFLEGFCDLSSFTNEGGTESLSDMIDISSLTDGSFEQDLVRLLRKRPLTETSASSSTCTESSAAQTIITPQAFPHAVVNTDHDMYTCNAKQARLSTSSQQSRLSSSSRLSSTGSELPEVDAGEPSSSNKSSPKYAERRRKNNIASRRSRQTRKQKHASMEQRVDDLQRTNAALEQQIAQLEHLTKTMKHVLVEKLSTKTQ